MRGARAEDGFTLVELCLTATIFAILAAIAIPGFTRARGAALETWTIGFLRGVHRAQTTYASSCAGGYYAPSLAWLATAPSANAQAFLGREYSTNPLDSHRYRVRFTAGSVVATARRTCNGLAQGRAVDGFFLAADPLTTTDGVTRHFGVNASGVVFQSTKKIAVTLTGNPKAPAKPIQ